MIRPTMVFVVITSTIGGLQIFAEPRLFDETNARNGGADRQFGTITMLIYDSGGSCVTSAGPPRPRGCCSCSSASSRSSTTWRCVGSALLGGG